MAKHFFSSFSLQELASYTNTKLIGNPDHRITNVDTLELATENDASFLANSRYEKAMLKSNAGVIFAPSSISLPAGQNFLIGNNPSNAFQMTVEAFHGAKQEFTAFTDIHPTAVVHPSAVIGEHVHIGPYAVIDKDVCIGNHSSIGAACYIGPATTIGESCLFHPHVTIRERCTIGNRVILQPGVVIGSCGFGYTPNEKGEHIKLTQLGIVRIEDDVEIGANTTIDRSRFKTTEIRQGTKIDNQVQIGHGVIVGQNNLFVAQTGISGSSKTGKNVILAGQVGVAGHLEINDNIVVAGKGGVTKSLKKPGRYAGYPAIPLQEHNRQSVHLRNISSYLQKIKNLESRLEEKKETKGT